MFLLWDIVKYCGPKLDLHDEAYDKRNYCLSENPLDLADNMYIIFILSLVSFLWDIFKQYKSRSDASNEASAQGHYCW